MKKYLAALLMVATPVLAQATAPDLSGSYVSNGPCECLEYVQHKKCPITPPALNVFTNSVLQHNRYVNPAESGATITLPNGTKKSVKMWVYKNSIGGPEFKVREGDDVEVSFETSVNNLIVTAKNNTLAQDSFSFALVLPADNANGGEVDQPPMTDTNMDDGGIFHKQIQTDRYENFGTGEKGIQTKTSLLMLLKDAGANGLDVGRITDIKSKRDGSWSDPQPSFFESLRCPLKKK